MRVDRTAVIHNSSKIKGLIVNGHDGILGCSNQIPDSNCNIGCMYNPAEQDVPFNLVVQTFEILKPHDTAAFALQMVPKRSKGDEFLATALRRVETVVNAVAMNRGVQVSEQTIFSLEDLVADATLGSSTVETVRSFV